MNDPQPPPPPPPPPSQAAPGWYPTTPGVQAYWDGQQWTGDIAPLPPGTSMTDDRTMATLVHLLGFFTSFVGPLVLFLIKKDESPFVRAHAAEALNFQITVIIASIGSLILLLVLVGILTLLATAVLAIVFPIMGAVAANRGEEYRYPINMRFVR